MAYASSTLRTVYTTEPSIVGDGPVYVERIRPLGRNACNRIPVLTKSTFAILLFTNILYVFVFATPVWITSHEFLVGGVLVRGGTAGLWSECGRVGIDADLCQSLVTGSSVGLIVAEVFASLAVVTSSLTLFTLIAYLLIYNCGRKRLYSLTIFCLLLLTALLLVIVLIVYSVLQVESTDVLAWVFALCCCCPVLYFIAAIIFLPEVNKPYERRADKHMDITIPGPVESPYPGYQAQPAYAMY